MENWSSCLSDGQMALKYDPNNTKASYLMGLSCKHLNDLQASVSHLEKAFVLAEKLNKTKIFQNEIFIELKRTKKMLFFQEKHEMAKKHAQLKQKLKKMMHLMTHKDVEEEHEKDEEWKSLDDIYAYVDHLTQVHETRVHTSIISSSSSTSSTSSSSATSFSQVDMFHIPEYFMCPVSMDIMLDPVLTPNGVSYERVFIEQHIQKNGPVDPLTRQKLTIDMLRPNNGLKAAIRDFLDQNPWAFEADL